MPSDIMLGIYFLMPAYAANMAALLSRTIKFRPPIDFNLELFSERIFGKGKTWTGAIFGILTAIICAYLLGIFYFPFSTTPLIWGAICGTGAILGDLTKSFIKRRIHIPPGTPWIPFDQIDFAIGALTLGKIIYNPGVLNFIILVILSAIGHIIVNHAAYALNLRKEKW